jgi:hypothetical protein
MLRLCIALVLLAGPASAFAQSVFDPGDSDLRIGQRVRVLVDGTCHATPCPPELVKGKLAELSETSIVVDDGRIHRQLDTTKIAFLERPRDRIWNGVLIGFVLGFTCGFVSVMAEEPCDGWICPFSGPGFATALGLLSGGVGAGIGAITDASMSDARIVFARTAPRASASPGTSVRAVSFTVRF